MLLFSHFPRKTVKIGLFSCYLISHFASENGVSNLLMFSHFQAVSVCSENRNPHGWRVCGSRWEKINRSVPSYIRVGWEKISISEIRFFYQNGKSLAEWEED